MRSVLVGGWFFLLSPRLVSNVCWVSYLYVRKYTLEQEEQEGEEQEEQEGGVCGLMEFFWSLLCDEAVAAKLLRD